MHSISSENNPLVLVRKSVRNLGMHHPLFHRLDLNRQVSLSNHLQYDVMADL